MASLAGGVCVVTTRVAGVDHAMTATAVSALSLDPPLVLVSVDHQARFHGAMSAADSFAVTFLASDQTDVALHFANRGRDLASQFDRVATVRLGVGALVVAGSLYAIAARVHSRLPGGDHTLVLGELIDTWAEPDSAHRRPLVHFRGSFSALP